MSQAIDLNNATDQVKKSHLKQVVDTATCLYTKRQVEQALDQMAQTIEQRFGQTMPVLLCVVIGGIVTLGQLLTRFNFPLEVDYIHVSRYHGAFSGQNKLNWLAYPTTSLKGRTVLLIDDIIDGGITLQAIYDYALSQGAKKIYSAALIDKPKARLPEGLPNVDVCGLTIGNEFIYGYGMDYQNYLRNAAGIFSVHPDLLK
jgi:hypoxanthine phosphoribosyltransferase